MGKLPLVCLTRAVSTKVNAHNSDGCTVQLEGPVSIPRGAGPLLSPLPWVSVSLGATCTVDCRLCRSGC